jgi:general secretion pathway protein K
MDFQTRVDLRAAGHFLDETQAFHLAKSAIPAGQMLLKHDQINSNVYDHESELWAAPITDYPLGNGLLTAQMQDEAGKFNLNRLAPQGVVNPQRVSHLTALLVRLDVSQLQADALVAAMVDWIDPDDVETPNGAESSVYRQRTPPYAAKNAPFDTLDELRRVDGMTDALYKKLSPFLTVHGAQTGKINVNTADLRIVQSMDDGIDDAMIERLKEERPFKNMAEIKGIIPDPTYGKIQTFLDVRSDHFSVEAVGQVNETRKRVSAIIGRNPRRLLYFKVD